MTWTASAAVVARSSASRSRSMPMSPGAGSLPAWVKTASLPITTPCSLAPISAPQIHHGRDSTTAWVWAAWSTWIQVQRTDVPGLWSRAGTQSRNCASFGSRSLFLANRTPSAVRETSVSHTRAIVPTAPDGGSGGGQAAGSAMTAA